MTDREVGCSWAYERRCEDHRQESGKSTIIPDAGGGAATRATTGPRIPFF
jgi:hypothetical protein